MRDGRRSASSCWITVELAGIPEKALSITGTMWWELSLESGSQVRGVHGSRDSFDGDSH